MAWFVHRCQYLLRDLLVVRASVELVCDGDGAVAEEVFDQGQVFRPPVELGGDAVPEEMRVEVRW
jgi:hypothetical protein